MLFSRKSKFTRTTGLTHAEGTKIAAVIVGAGVATYIAIKVTNLYNRIGDAAVNAINGMASDVNAATTALNDVKEDAVKAS